MAVEINLTYEEKKEILVREAQSRFPNMKKGVYFYRPFSERLKVTSCDFESESIPDHFEYQWLSDTLYYYGTAIFERGEWAEMLDGNIVEIVSSPIQYLLEKYKGNIDILRYIHSVSEELPHMVNRAIKENERAADTGKKD